MLLAAYLILSLLTLFEQFTTSQEETENTAEPEAMEDEQQSWSPPYGARLLNLPSDTVAVLKVLIMSTKGRCGKPLLCTFSLMLLLPTSQISGG